VAMVVTSVAMVVTSVAMVVTSAAVVVTSVVVGAVFAMIMVVIVVDRGMVFFGVSPMIMAVIMAMPMIMRCRMLSVGTSRRIWVGSRQ